MFLKKELLVEKAQQLKESLWQKKSFMVDNYRQELEKVLSGNSDTCKDSEDEDEREMWEKKLHVDQLSTIHELRRLENPKAGKRKR